MRRIYLLTAVLFVTINLQAKTYYISADGKNTNDGLTTSTAWQTISKINSFSFATNDIILFRRGDVFYGGIEVKRSGLNFGAYGTGDKPVISGTSTVSGWVDLGNNIWEAPVTNVKKAVNLVVRDGTPQQVGRYPNANAANGGYFTFTSSTATSITGTALSSTTNWTGAEVAFKSNRWTINRQIVTSHSGGTVHFASNPTTPRVNYGYFFQRDSRTLDQDGEWWYNSSAGKLRMYLGNDNPKAYTIQIATVDTLFKCQYFNNIAVSDLSFEGAGKSAIWFNGGSYITVTNCDVLNTGKEAITAKSSINVDVENCTTTNSLNSGIEVVDYGPGAVNLTIKGCTVTNTAYLAGMESNNESGGDAIRCMGGDNVHVTNNKVINSGYIGIKWQGNSVFIKYNLVDRFCTMRDDGAGIYSWEDPNNPVTRSNRNIVSNIVLNGIGSSQGTSDTKSTSVQGLYFDIGSKAVVADSNTVAYIANGAVHGNNCGNLTITNNLFFHDGRTHSFQRFADGDLVRNLIIRKNIMYPYLFRYRNLGINSPSMTKEADMKAMGSIDSNYYSLGPDVDTSCTTVTTNNDNSDYQEDYYGFSYLANTVGIEKHAVKLANTGTLEYNASNAPRIVTFSGLSKKDVYGKIYTNSVTIPAWSSKLLLPNGTTDPSNKPPVANAGTAKIITLPVSSVTLAGTGSDADGGTITKYSWAKISGPSEGTISVPLAATTLVLSLAEGIYQFELTVTDNAGAMGRDTVQVTVNGQASSLRPAVNPSPLANGLDYKYYEGAWLVLPAFGSLTAVKSGTVSNIDLSPTRVAEHFGFTFTGFISVPADGNYTFYTNSDDGSKLYIDDVLTVANDGLHGPTEKSGVIGLKAGKHYLSAQFFNRGGGYVFELRYQSSSISKRLVPSSALYRITSTANRTITGGGMSISGAGLSVVTNTPATVDNKKELKITGYPNPSTTEFSLLVEGGTNEKIAISAMDAAGRIVYETNGVSNNNYRFGSKLQPGIYIIKLMQGTGMKTIKLVKL
jgi:hypothetical protein